MAPTTSPEAGGRPGGGLSPGEGELLLEVARSSIRRGVETGFPLAVDPEGYPERLRAPGAAFVTLEREGRLRGCVGSLEPHYPLVEDVARNAFAAAFHDPRFPPLAARELEGLDVHISVLGDPEPLRVGSEEELVAALRPGVDGLILEEPPYRATFLPQVWESLPDPAQFVARLKAKAGLPPDYWSPRLRVARYTVQEIR